MIPVPHSDSSGLPGHKADSQDKPKKGNFLGSRVSSHFWKPCSESNQILAGRPSVLEATPSPSLLPRKSPSSSLQRYLFTLPITFWGENPPSATGLLFPLLGTFPATRDTSGNAAGPRRGQPGEAPPAPHPLPHGPRVAGESETKKKKPSWAAIRPVPRTPTSRERGYRWSSGARRSPAQPPELRDGGGGGGRGGGAGDGSESRTGRRVTGEGPEDRGAKAARIAGAVPVRGGSPSATPPLPAPDRLRAHRGTMKKNNSAKRVSREWVLRRGKAG